MIFTLHIGASQL